MRSLAWMLLAFVAAGALFAAWLAPFRYEEMLRDDAGAGPTHTHLLGTDASGRDRFSRLLYGTQISLLLAPAAAILSTILAALAGSTAALKGGFMERLFFLVSDLFLCLPWMFLLIAARALLPLNAGPGMSVMLTFLLLGLLGWAGPARIIRARVRHLLQRDDRLLVRAAGIAPRRAFFIHLLPNLWPIATAQFWLAVPVFILSEANLSLIGLGVSEPLPSWGNLLRELESLGVVAEAPWLLVPVVLLVTVIAALQFLVSAPVRQKS